MMHRFNQIFILPLLFQDIYFVHSIKVSNLLFSLTDEKFWRIFICIIRYKFNCLEKRKGKKYGTSSWHICHSPQRLTTWFNVYVGPASCLCYYSYSLNFYFVTWLSWNLTQRKMLRNIPVHCKLTSQYPILVCIYIQSKPSTSAYLEHEIINFIIVSPAPLFKVNSGKFYFWNLLWYTMTKLYKFVKDRYYIICWLVERELLCHHEDDLFLWSIGNYHHRLTTITTVAHDKLLVTLIR